MKSLSPWLANPAVCAPAFIKIEIIGQSRCVIESEVDLLTIRDAAEMNFAEDVTARIFFECRLFDLCRDLTVDVL